MIKLNGDMSGISYFTGAVEGILDGVDSESFQSNFSSYCMKNLRKRFMTDTIASHMAGNQRIQHMFEWPDQDASGVSTRMPNPQPLFALTMERAGKRKVMGFKILPSTELVPLPDPSATGFDPDKLQYLRRHKFAMKAVVMESNSTVTVAPRLSRKLFIPSASSKKGYVMSSRPVNINPGGAQATGGFAEWWSMWFAGPARSVMVINAERAEELIAKTGRKVVRYAAGTTRNGKNVGGQFASGKAVTMRMELGYVSAGKRMAEQELKMAAKYVFDEEEDWDDE